MENRENYSLGLLSLVFVLINSDGEISDNELNYLIRIKEMEQIPDSVFEHFRKSILEKDERAIYHVGINSINNCTDDLKIRAFVKMYQMAYADGIIHVKEVRLLLYAVKMANVDINSVIALAKAQELVMA